MQMRNLEMHSHKISDKTETNQPFIFLLLPPGETLSVITLDVNQKGSLHLFSAVSSLCTVSSLKTKSTSSLTIGQTLNSQFM